MRFRRALVAAWAVSCAVAPVAWAGDPGLWAETGSSRTSVNYWQGVSFDASLRKFYFDGVSTGLYRTTDTLTQEAGTRNVIPSAVKNKEGYNHLGDLSFDTAEGGRVLLPLECYHANQPDPNTCDTGAVGVADPATLAWRYYVKLDPVDISKAMWNEVSPDGTLIWTSSGTSLLAYDATASDNGVHAGNDTLTTDKVITPVLRHDSVLPASGVTGATFYGGRLFVAVNEGSALRVYSYDLASSDSLLDRRLEIERSATLGESEGLATANALNGELHWQIHPSSKTYGRIYHFRPNAG